MQIDWFTFSAQVVNFLILLALLRRFLYRPLLGVMERRQREIEERLEEGRRMQDEARQRADELERRHAELEERREDELRRIEEEVEERRAELMREVRRQVEERRRSWSEALEREREAFLHELAERTARQAVAIARSALAELAGADLERAAVARFVDTLEGLGDAERAELARAAERAEDDPRVESAFELPDAERRRVRRALDGVVPEGRTLRFARSESIAFGVELTVGGLELGWSLERYLGDLEERVTGLIREEARGGPGHGEAA